MRYAPLIALLAFWLLDVLADRRAIPSVTVSEQVWALGLPGRIAASLALLVLASHLALQWPLGPTASRARVRESELRFEKIGQGEPKRTLARNLHAGGLLGRFRKAAAHADGSLEARLRAERK